MKYLQNFNYFRRNQEKITNHIHIIFLTKNNSFSLYFSKFDSFHNFYFKINQAFAMPKEKNKLSHHQNTSTWHNVIEFFSLKNILKLYNNLFIKIFLLILILFLNKSRMKKILLTKLQHRNYAQSTCNISKITIKQIRLLAKLDNYSY